MVDLMMELLNFFKRNKRCYGVDPSIIKLNKYYKKGTNLIPLTFEKGYNIFQKKI